MTFEAFLSPTLEFIAIILSIYFSGHYKMADRNLHTMLMMEKFRESKRYRFTPVIWEMGFSSVLVVGIYVAYKYGSGNINGPFLLVVVNYIIAFLTLYGFLYLFHNLSSTRKRISKIIFASVLLSVFLAVILMILIWYLTYVITLTILASYLPLFSETEGAFVALLYYLLFVVSYFSLAFLVMSAVLRPIWYTLLNNVISRDSSHIVEVELSNKNKHLQLKRIYPSGLLVEEGDDILTVSWKNVRNIRISGSRHTR